MHTLYDVYIYTYTYTIYMYSMWTYHMQVNHPLEPSNRISGSHWQFVGSKRE